MLILSIVWCNNTHINIFFDTVDMLGFWGLSVWLICSAPEISSALLIFQLPGIFVTVDMVGS